MGLKLGQSKPEISGTVPTNRHTTIPNDSGPSSACFDEDPKLFNCEIAQLRIRAGTLQHTRTSKETGRPKPPPGPPWGKCAKNKLEHRFKYKFKPGKWGRDKWG